MTPTRFLVGQILVVFAIVIGGLWLSTEWVAAALGFQPRLGLPWSALLSPQVYHPWRLFEWWYAFDAYVPTLFNKAGIMAASSGVAGIVVAIIGSLSRARQSRLATTYGSSRWTSRPNIEAAGLFRPAGVFLGQLRGRYLRHDGPEHVMGRTAVVVPLRPTCSSLISPSLSVTICTPQKRRDRASRAIGQERFKSFVEQVSRGVAAARGLIDDVPASTDASKTRSCAAIPRRRAAATPCFGPQWLRRSPRRWPIPP